MVPVSQGKQKAWSPGFRVGWFSEESLHIQHKVRLYFSLTQFHILKSQACTTYMQAAQICTLEAQERGRWREEFSLRR